MVSATKVQPHFAESRFAESLTQTLTFGFGETGFGETGRAGFSLSRALFRKKCVGPSPGVADLLEKTGTPE